jgi:ribulose-phosphate 3-epimerase
MAEIIPAIMPETIEELESAVALVRGTAKWVQVDVMDGKFVPERSWPFPNFETETAALLGEDKGLPFWQDVNYEFDLMIREPEKFAEKFVSIGGGRVIIHYESADKDKIWEAVRKVQGMITEVGLAIDTATPNEVLDEFLADERPVDFVQFMGIAKIGYQGQPFDERVLGKIEALRAKYSDIIISVDGSVNFETAPLLVKAGANRLAAGSVIFKSGDAREAIYELEDLEDLE